MTGRPTFIITAIRRIHHRESYNPLHRVIGDWFDATRRTGQGQQEPYAVSERCVPPQDTTSSNHSD